MSGLLALLDDVAGITKIAAASVDDAIGQATKAGSKAAAALIDDAAVTPKYVTGFKPARELPIVWKIAKGSLRNKMLFLLPGGLFLAAFAPWIITPLLMLGGTYLAFEGAEKIHGLFVSHKKAADKPDEPIEDAAHLEEQKVSGAIKTDFILSAEIMTISLAAIPESSFWMEAATLALVAVGITVLVYGSVALIVKADDFGLLLAKSGRLSVTRALGRGIVKAMPFFLKALLTVGTAAMLWVGGSIIVHGLKDLGFAAIYDGIHGAAAAISHGIGRGEGFFEWVVTATLDGICGLLVGLVVLLVIQKGIEPIWRTLRGQTEKTDQH